MSEQCQHEFTHNAVTDNRNGTETVFVYCNDCHAMLDFYVRQGGFNS